MKDLVKTRRGFTLIELLVATSVLAIMLLILLGVTNQTSQIWRHTSGRIEQFREAREGFESMTRRLSQATLNTFWDYDNTVNPTRYVRQSELRFISGRTSELVGGTRNFTSYGVFFNAPLGMTVDAPEAEGLNNLLNTWGYFIEYGDDTAIRPPIITPAIAPPRNRFRLYEFAQPANSLSIYNFTSGKDAGGAPKNLSYTGREWFANSVNAVDTIRPVRALAENVIALVILPKLPPQDDSTGVALSPDYRYDSTAGKNDPAINPRNQLPPVLQITMVAMDEASAARLTEEENLALRTHVNSLFTDASKFEKDLTAGNGNQVESLEDYLIARNISYRIFTSNISIQGAKWSTDQRD